MERLRARCRGELVFAPIKIPALATHTQALGSGSSGGVGGETMSRHCVGDAAGGRDEWYRHHDTSEGIAKADFERVSTIGRVNVRLRRQIGVAALAPPWRVPLFKSPKLAEATSA